MRTQISNFIAYKLIDSQASTRGRFWPFSIKILYYFSLSTGANQKIIEKKADLWYAKNWRPIWPKKVFDFLMLRRLENVFQDEKFFFRIF